jgi:hypothetical protein
LFPNRVDELATTYVRHGVTWTERDWQLTLGHRCAEDSVQEVEIQVPGIAATGLAMVSCLGHAADVVQGTAILAIDVDDGAGAKKTLHLRAGVHTAEMAWERIQRSGGVGHAMAPVFRSTPSADGDGHACSDHHYLAMLPFERTRRITHLRVRWVGPDDVIFKCFKLTLTGTNRAGDYVVPESAGIMGDPRRWRPVADGIWENRRALPRAWLASRAIPFDPEAILEIVHSGRLPDGALFDPRATALVEETLNLNTVRGADDAVQVVREASSVLEVATQADGPRFLVVSDVYYPGWRASMDGRAARVLRTDYLLRGVALPAGTHTVRFVFRPMSFYAGCTLTALSAAVLAVLGAIALRGSARKVGSISG